MPIVIMYFHEVFLLIVWIIAIKFDCNGPTKCFIQCFCAFMIIPIVLMSRFFSLQLLMRVSPPLHRSVVQIQRIYQRSDALRVIWPPGSLVVNLIFISLLRGYCHAKTKKVLYGLMFQRISAIVKQLVLFCYFVVLLEDSLNVERFPLSIISKMT